MGAAGRDADAIVIGAGIVGAACARALAQAGLRVRVLDARVRAATHAGMGHLVAMDDNAAELTLSHASQALWRAWAGAMPAACAYAPIGTLWVAANAHEMDEAERKAQRLRAHGVPCALWSAAQLAAAEPALRPGLAGALHVPGDGIVYAPLAARWLLHGVPVERAQAVAVQGDCVRLADGSVRRAPVIVLAAGIDAPRLAPGLPLRPKKGHIAITDRYPGAVRHQLVELGYVSSAHASHGDSVAFNVQPRPTGQLLIGSSRQFDTTDPAVEPAMLARMLRSTLAYLPGLADVNVIRTWTGFRAATPDGLPLIGRHPAQPHLWLAVGHEGLGVTTAPGTAQLLAAQITGAPPPFDADPYAPARLL